MGRQSDFYQLASILLACSLIVVVLSTWTRALPALQIVDRKISPLDGAEWQSTSLQGQPVLNTGFAAEVPQAILRNLPRGTRIVVGSLDVSGSRHVITLRNSDSAPVAPESTAIVRFAATDVHRKGEATGLFMVPSDVVLDSLDLRASDDTEFETIPVPGDAEESASPRRSRVFLVPHFSDTGIYNAPAECYAIHENDRVRLYLDQHIVNSGHPNRTAEFSKCLLPAVTLDALPIVEEWIGSIRDADHDQKLSIVITDLDQRSKLLHKASPVHACIREADFESESCFGGDIIYVDLSILEFDRREQASLLTHELTHAAIRSSLSDVSDTPASDSTDHRLPPWMNEAIAHCMELRYRLNSDQPAIPQNLDQRIDDFLGNSAGSPIVAAESVMSLEERRSGSRAAATLFLAPWLTSPERLRSFIHSDSAPDRRIEELACGTFADEFRNWTLSIAAKSFKRRQLRVDTICSRDSNERYSLIGTAFRCFECSEEVTCLVVKSDDAARLQISIIEPESSAPTFAEVPTSDSEFR